MRQVLIEQDVGGCIWSVCSGGVVRVIIEGQFVNRQMAVRKFVFEYVGKFEGTL